MKKHIVFHSDIDGVICAALYVRYRTNKNDEYILHPVFSAWRSRFEDIIKSMNLSEDDELYIFDFAYNERANLWVDHHSNTKLGSHKISNKKIVYSMNAKSAARLLFETINIESEELEKVISSVDMIDSAGYPDVKYIFEDNSPIMVMRAVLEQTSPQSIDTFSRMVEVIAELGFDLEKVVSRLNIGKDDIKRLCSKINSSKKCLTIYNNISVIDQKRLAEYPRYSECIVAPDVRYNVRMTSQYKKIIVQVSYNNWQKIPNDTNIGDFLAKLPYVAGGGHFSAGGCSMKLEHAERFLNDLSIATKNEEDSVIEKLGVDENDQVEKTAIEMVKKGDAVNLDDARQDIVNKGESVNESRDASRTSGSSKSSRRSEKEPSETAQ